MNDKYWMRSLAVQIDASLELAGTKSEEEKYFAFLARKKRKYFSRLIKYSGSFYTLYLALMAKLTQTTKFASFSNND